MYRLSDDYWISEDGEWHVFTDGRPRIYFGEDEVDLNSAQFDRIIVPDDVMEIYERFGGTLR